MSRGGRSRRRGLGTARVSTSTARGGALTGAGADAPHAVSSIVAVAAAIRKYKCRIFNNVATSRDFATRPSGISRDASRLNAALARLPRTVPPHWDQETRTKHSPARPRLARTRARGGGRYSTLSVTRAKSMPPRLSWETAQSFSSPGSLGARSSPRNSSFQPVVESLSKRTSETLP
jgi:hypothetical protein